jgi:hypothetical protein
MSRDAKQKSRGGKKDSAVKNTFNPSPGSGPIPDTRNKGSEEQDPKRRIGQYGGAGEPPILKK